MLEPNEHVNIRKKFQDSKYFRGSLKEDFLEGF
jgi:hypothetical protein